MARVYCCGQLKVVVVKGQQTNQCDCTSARIYIRMCVCVHVHYNKSTGMGVEPTVHFVSHNISYMGNWPWCVGGDKLWALYNYYASVCFYGVTDFVWRAYIQTYTLFCLVSSVCTHLHMMLHIQLISIDHWLHHDTHMWRHLFLITIIFTPINYIP